MIFQTHLILITVSHQIIVSVASVWQKSYRVAPPTRIKCQHVCSLMMEVELP